VENTGCGFDNVLLSRYNIGLLQSRPVTTFKHFSAIFSLTFINCLHGGNRFIQKFGKHLTTCTESYLKTQQSSLLYRQETKTESLVAKRFVISYNCVCHHQNKLRRVTVSGRCQMFREVHFLKRKIKSYTKLFIYLTYIFVV
jgi:hypothetical protein